MSAISLHLSSHPRDDFREHVGGVGEDDLLLDVLRPVHVDPRGSRRPPGQGLFLKREASDLPSGVNSWQLLPLG